MSKANIIEAIDVGILSLGAVLWFAGMINHWVETIAPVEIRLRQFPTFTIKEYMQYFFAIPMLQSSTGLTVTGIVIYTLGWIYCFIAITKKCSVFAIFLCTWLMMLLPMLSDAAFVGIGSLEKFHRLSLCFIAIYLLAGILGSGLAVRAAAMSWNDNYLKVIGRGLLVVSLVLGILFLPVGVAAIRSNGSPTAGTALLILSLLAGVASGVVRVYPSGARIADVKGIPV